MTSFLWNIGREVSPDCAVVRPQGEKSPVGGVDGWHERPDTVNLGDVACDDGENISREGSCSTYPQRIVEQRIQILVVGKRKWRHGGQQLSSGKPYDDIGPHV
jgi:hypothetical protein